MPVQTKQYLFDYESQVASNSKYGQNCLPTFHKTNIMDVFTTPLLIL